ncbi:hypothetical protein ACHWQZ_G012014 [Mnemiopsis leidyi]
MRLYGQLTKEQEALVESKMKRAMRNKANEETRRTVTAERKPAGQIRLRDKYEQGSHQMFLANRFRSSETSKQIERESREARDRKDRERKAKINSSELKNHKTEYFKSTIAGALGSYMPHN